MSAADIASEQDLLAKLSSTDQLVAALARAGKSPREIARLARLDPTTVENSIYRARVAGVTIPTINPYVVTPKTAAERHKPLPPPAKRAVAQHVWTAADDARAETLACLSVLTATAIVDVSRGLGGAVADHAAAIHVHVVGTISEEVYRLLAQEGSVQ